jgi:hypothetical protein
MTPISLRNRCGASWNTAPLPAPRASIENISTARAIQAEGIWKLAGQAQGGQGEDDGQGPHPAEAVGQGPADRPDERAGEHAGGGEEAGDHRGQAVFGVEVDGQGRGQADEAAEGHGVEQHQPPGVRDLQHVHIFGQLLGRGLLGGVLGQQHVDDEGDGQREWRPGRSRSASRRSWPGSARTGRPGRCRSCRPRRCPGPGPGAPADTSARPAAGRRRTRRRRRRAPRPGPAPDDSCGCPAPRPATRPASTISWPMMPVFLGPMRSTSTPLTSRSSAPASTGMATIRPFWAGSRWKSLAMATPSGPRITQTMKLRSKYRNAANRVGVWPAFRKSREIMMRLGCCVSARAGRDAPRAGDRIRAVVSGSHERRCPEA